MKVAFAVALLLVGYALAAAAGRRRLLGIGAGASPEGSSAAVASLRPRTRAVLEAFCSSCAWNDDTSCAERLRFLVNEYYLPEAPAKEMLQEEGRCVDPSIEIVPEPAESVDVDPPPDGQGQPLSSCNHLEEECHWWVNPLKAESCATGPHLPPGDRWDLYGTRDGCCQTNFPTSQTCSIEQSVVYYPANSAPDQYEVVRMKFDVGGLPRETVHNDLDGVLAEMKMSLKRILIWLSVPGLQIASVSERDVKTNGIRERERGLRNMPERALHDSHDDQTATAHYDVFVLQEEGRGFGPEIIGELRKKYAGVMDQIRSFQDTPHLTGDNLTLNWCTFEKQLITHCVKASLLGTVRSAGMVP